jgi:hypothetical protein
MLMLAVALVYVRTSARLLRPERAEGDAAA